MPSNVAERYAECPLSFKPLHLGAVGVFLDASGRRVGGFYRLEAAEAFLAGGGSRCPVTEQPVARVREVPSILADPKAWFRICDADGDRRLSRDEVVTALKAQLPLDNDSIEKFLRDDAAWRMWDTDGSGFIEYTEIMDEDRGLLKFVRDTFSKAEAERPVPDLRTERHAWYRRWDEDGSGELEFEEVVRAFAKTFKIDVHGITELRATLRDIWCVFDTDGSGSIDKKEFMAPNDGLADTVLATMSLSR